AKDDRGRASDQEPDPAEPVAWRAALDDERMLLAEAPPPGHAAEGHVPARHEVAPGAERDLADRLVVVGRDRRALPAAADALPAAVRPPPLAPGPRGARCPQVPRPAPG